MKPLVIYHDNCADGFGAAFATWLVLGDEAEYKPMAYGFAEVPDYIDREVYMVDFSWPKEHMDDLFREAKRVVWLDHHKTAFEMMGYPVGVGHADFKNNELDYILDNNKSGAMLAWEYFHPGTEVPMLIKHIDDYDRWQFKLKGTKEINKAVWSMSPWTFEQWATYLALDDEYGQLWTEGAAILRAHDQNVQSVVKGAARPCAIEVNVKGKKVRGALKAFSIDPAPKFSGLAANCPPHLTSDVGHELASQSGTFGLMWQLAQEGMIANCSLRSNGDYDVSVIAKAFDGGGHKNAAGFQVPITTLLDWMQ